MKKSDVWQFIKFSLVGVSNTLISEGIYAIMIFFRIHYIPASFTGFSLSVLNAFYWNQKYVFQEREDCEKRVWWKVLGKTYIAYFWGYLVNVALLALWIDLLQISRFLAPLGNWFAELGFSRFNADFLGELLAAAINLVITVPMNFVINKYWAYRQKKKET